MAIGTLTGFAAVALLAYVTPGPDWFVVMRHAAAGRRHGVAAALGVQSGLVVHMTAAALGVAALVLASAEAFTVLKLAGAAYLVLLGVQALRHARRPVPDEAEEHPPARAGTIAVYRSSLVANVLNPKAALFFVAILPQFVDGAAPVAPQALLLGAVDIALGLVWWAVFVRAILHVRRLLGARRSAVALDRVSGTALIGLGGALAVTTRAQA